MFVNFNQRVESRIFIEITNEVIESKRNCKKNSPLGNFGIENAWKIYWFACIVLKK